MGKHNKAEVTAFIYDRRGNILSIGKNSYIKTHPLQAKHAAKMGNLDAIYLHAEIHAIARCKTLDKAYKILVVRFDKAGNAKMAKPCPICQSAINQSSIKRVEYTTDDGTYKSELQYRGL
jgi:tRNA(Arg) A34 adenosine deaminase TadA